MKLTNQNAPINAPENLMRPPTELMRLSRMGRSFQSRLSFMRRLVRKIHNEKWVLKRSVFNLDDDGFGHAVYTADTGSRLYSLIVFSHDLPPEKRTDRVIAEAWDATFNLFDGVPSDADITRLQVNTPLQEAGRFSSQELVLARANKSLRLFDHFVDSLAKGSQPDIELVSSVGYLMRTTAVYGSGKFGCADRKKSENRNEVQPSFTLEMLAVYLFRWFTMDMVEHVAQAKGGDKAITLDNEIKRYLGIGNSTGLGMAPFLLKHPILIHQWAIAKEEALVRCRSQNEVDSDHIVAFEVILQKALKHIHEWQVADEEQMAAIIELRQEISSISGWLETLSDTNKDFWNRLYEHARANFGLEGQNLIESLIIECNGALVDDLAETMFADESFQLDATMSIAQLKLLIEAHYQWALDIDFLDPSATKRFWYYSEEKLEPRFGDRENDPGAELEMPLAIARDIKAMHSAFLALDDEVIAAEFLMTNPDMRHLVKRIQLVARYPYAEICDNLVDDKTRPLDILRFKLAFFGASKFDPKSDLWTRINMYQGAPIAAEVLDRDPDSWAFPIKPSVGDRS